MKTLIAAALLATALAGAAPAAHAAPLAPVAGEVIVQFKPGAAVTRAHALPARAAAGTVRDVLARRAAAMGTRLGRKIDAGSAVGVRTQVLRASGMSAAELAAMLAADPDVEFAVPNGRARRLTAPNDPLYALSTTERRSNGITLQDGPASGQWYLRAPAATLAAGPVSSIDIERAWARSRGSEAVVVAVLDTGVRPEHPDLNGRLLPGYDFVSDTTVANDGGGRDADPSDPGDWVTSAEAGRGSFTDCVAESSSWHGTKTAALVGASADDGIGMAGTAPGVGVLPVRVLGKCYGSASDIQTAMRWAAGLSVPGVPSNPNPAKVLNLSLGGTGACDADYQSAVNDVLATGAVIVAAAGNSAGGPVNTPANCAGVIGVAALRHAGSKVGFSDQGPEIKIAAPGGNCVNVNGGPCLYPLLTATNTGTTVPVASRWTDSYDASVGTSFASPLVAATAGLMFSVQPGLTPAMLLARMQATARPFPTTGADNGSDTLPVRRCDTPNRFPSNPDRDSQCYCTTALCGAGMLDAGAAVNAVSGPVARITVSTASPTAGSAVNLSAAGSLVAAGSTITRYQWTLTPGSGIVSAFDSADNADTATLTPSAAGGFTVTLLVEDSQGNTGLATQTVTVAAVPVPTPVTPPATAGGGGGGGGSTSASWLALLALAAAALFRDARRRRRA